MTDRCSECTPTERFVQGCGPCPASVVFIGEKPGQEEANRGIPFVGKTGQELDNTYLPLAGLTRDDLYITNTVKCRTGGSNKKPSLKQIKACAGMHIAGELADCNPRLVILGGATAAEMLDEPIDLMRDHGIVDWRRFKKEYGGWEGPVVVTYHPAVGLHNTGMMAPLMEDFRRIGRWLKTPKPLEKHFGFDHPWAPIHSTIDYKLIEHSDEIHDDLHEFIASNPWEFLIPIDTEFDDEGPFSLQYSIRPGHGRMIINPKLITYFLQYKERLPFLGFKGYILHNAPADLPEIFKLGGDTTLPFRDTMQEAYGLRTLPQGLKALAYRLLGIRMKSWEDTVLPHSKQKLLAWMQNALWRLSTDCRIPIEKQLKTKLKIEYKKSDAEKRLAGIMRCTQEQEKHPDYDPWKLMFESPPIVKHAEEYGWWPKRSIRHVPLDEAVHYGCQDADVTGRVAIVLELIRQSRMSWQNGGKQMNYVDGDAGQTWYVAKEDWD